MKRANTNKRAIIVWRICCIVILFMCGILWGSQSEGTPVWPLVVITVLMFIGNFVCLAVEAKQEHGEAIKKAKQDVIKQFAEEVKNLYEAYDEHLPGMFSEDLDEIVKKYEVE